MSTFIITLFVICTSLIPRYVSSVSFNKIAYAPNNIIRFSLTAH